MDAVELVIITIIATIITVVIHYEGLNIIFKLINKIKIPPRMKALVLVLGLLVTHLIEICVFAFGYLLIATKSSGEYFRGDFHFRLFDYLYYSSVVYTALGFGDLTPLGAIRFMTSMEALTGILLMSWSASLTFIHMQKFWKED